MGLTELVGVKSLTMSITLTYLRPDRNDLGLNSILRDGPNSPNYRVLVPVQN